MNKNILVTLLLLVAVQLSTQAQVMGMKEPLFNLDIKAGGNYTMLASAPVKSTPGFALGLSAWKPIGRFGIRLEAIGSTAGFTTQYPAAHYLIHTSGMDTVTKGKFQAIYLNVPLLVEYAISERLVLVAGPQFNYLISLTDQNNAFTKLYGKNSFIKKTDVAIAAGLEAFATKKIKAGIRLMVGVTDLNNSTYYLVPKAWTSAGAQLTISYKIM